MVYEGNHRLGDLFKSRRERGKPGLPTVSVTLTNGLVDRESLDRKTDTNLSEAEHLLVKKGDIAYNMMRMWQGASGLADKDGIVSPAYVVLAPKKNIDSRYAAYLFKSQRLIYLFWAYSYGLTEDRLRLYYGDFAKIPVTIPSVEEQAKIAKILSTWDKAIETTERLISNSKAQIRSLIQHLMVGNKFSPEFNNAAVGNVKFGTFCSLAKERCEPTSADQNLKCIELEHIESKTGRLLGYTRIDCQSSLKAMFKPGDVLFGKLRPYLKKSWLSDSEGYCSTEIWVLRAKRSRCLPEYLHLLCQTDKFASACHVTAGSKMPRAEWSVLSKRHFLLPPLKEQAAVTVVVSNATAVLEYLMQQLDLLRKEKKALMQRLLSDKHQISLNTCA